MERCQFRRGADRAARKSGIPISSLVRHGGSVIMKSLIPNSESRLVELEQHDRPSREGRPQVLVFASRSYPIEDCLCLADHPILESDLEILPAKDIQLGPGSL